MAHADFVHLRVHTAYSLLEGAIRIDSLAKLCVERRMPAVAITDTDNLFGALEFSKACAGAGIQPIIGCQITLARQESEQRGFGQRNQSALAAAGDPIVLLCQNEAGYTTLLKLLADAYLGAEAGEKPRVTIEALEARNDGLIALTGGAAGPIGRLLAEGQGEAAKALLQRFKAAFPDRLYVELMRHGLEAEDAVEGGLIDLAYGEDLPLVATNEAFFTDEDMFEAHDALLCVAGGAYVSQTDRRRLTPQHRFKSAEEMRVLFADLPEAVDNTLVIAKRCAFMVMTRNPILPAFPGTEEGRSEADEVRLRAREGLDRRLESVVLTPEMSADERERTIKRYHERLEYELGVIVEMGFPGYFLIVADFIRWAKERGIPVGPGRGSGAGSVVAWSLTITDLDPLRFGLLFERFLNPERISMPDFDVDFCQDRRDEVIRYVQGQYGQDRVAQIITFGKLQARAVLRDVGRVLEMPYGQVDRLCKLVPNNPANPVTLKKAIEMEPQLQQMIAGDEAIQRLVDIAQKLEGLYRHASTHAAGVVIGDRPLEQLVPLYRDPRSNMPITGFNMKFVELAGLVKFDFLGLKTLTVLVQAVKLLEERGIKLDLQHLPLDDLKSYKLMSSGKTVGLFQLESAGMQDVLRKLRPDTFEDIIAVVALYRPGPMDNIPSYIKRKHGEEEPDYLYPTLEGILKETFGIMIYQEQVMQIAQELSGYTLGNADILRRAMGKKIKEEMDQQREAFVAGAVARNVPSAKASQIFDQVAKFAGYGFNKSHAAAYALIAYQTAYLKANHPVEFLAASMTLDMGNPDKLGIFRQELERLGHRLLPPDINRSGVGFTVEDGSIRYALAAIKNVGRGAMEALVAEREKNGPFKDINDLSKRLDAKVVNKRQVENLVRAGALDGLNKNRAQLFAGVDSLIKQASAAAQDRDSNQISLFGEAMPAASASSGLPTMPDWAPMERLKEEFDAIGFYLSAHPLDAYASALRQAKVKTFTEITVDGRSGVFAMAGTVVDKRERTSARGSRYAFVRLSDTSGVYEITVFSEVLGSSRELLEVGQSLFVRVNAQAEGESMRLTAHSIEPLDKVAARTALNLKVFVESPDSLQPLQKLLAAEGKGARGQVVLVSRIDSTTEIEIELPGRYPLTPASLQAIRAFPGVGEVQEL
jgi:DNA polymerase-3 subunit alpha